mmetsp:Transcript_21512/g.30828  ORF Transcript_21512/g.30828 Transcript_21512/m.30828 type:complete len:976 (-) Transcript_21512:1166-4093(-)
MMSNQYYPIVVVLSKQLQSQERCATQIAPILRRWVHNNQLLTKSCYIIRPSLATANSFPAVVSSCTARYSSSSVLAEPIGAGIRNNPTYNKSEGALPLKVSIDKLEKQTKVLLSKVKALQHQQKGVTPSIRSQIYALIKSWDDLLWSKKRGGGKPVMFYQADIQRGVLAANELLDVVLLDDQRLYLSNTATNPSTGLGSDEESHTNNGLRNSCGMVINGWAHSGFHDAGWKAKRILETMEELYERGNNKYYKPILYTYNGVLNAFMRNMNQQKGSSNHIINIPYEMEQILNRMELLASTGRNPDALPNNMAYNMLITALSRSHDPKAGEKSEQILNRMQELYEQSPRLRANVRPDKFTFASVLDAWYKVATSSNHYRDSDAAARRAEAILRRMKNRKKDGVQCYVKPNSVVVSTVICAFTATAQNARKTGNHGAARVAAQRAFALLEGQIQSYLDGDQDMQPKLIIFNRVMDAFAKTFGPVRAEEILSNLEQLHQTCTGIEGPDVYSYTIVITAWSKCATRDAAERADAILQRMEALYLAGATKARPNNFTYNAVIIAYSRNRQGVVSAEKAEKLLERMERLTSIEGAEKSSNSASVGKHDDLRPDKITFSSVMVAWMNSNEPALAYSRVIALHEQMERLYHEGNEKCKPDTVSFSILISALAKSNEEDAPQKAEAVINRMKKFEGGLRPNVYTYNSLILAWVNSNQPDAMEKAEAIIEEMVKRSSGENGDKDAKPDHVTFSTILDGLSQRYNQEGVADRAEAMLEQMIDRYCSGTYDVQLTSYPFNNVIVIYARLGKIEEAVRILRRMETLHSNGTLPEAAPTVVTYNTILVGCAAVSTQDETRRRNVLSLAVFLLNEIENSETLQADSFTYGELFSVCGNMITDDEERSKSFLDLFQRCCRDGQINGFVISRFLAADALSGAALFWKLFYPYRDDNDYYVDIKKLPADWCRNVEGLPQHRKKGQKMSKTEFLD